MSTLIVDDLVIDPQKNIEIPLRELGHRVIRNVSQRHTLGQWNPNTTYNWVPGMFNDYTPLASNSRIRVYCTISYAGITGSSHAISHWIFYANGVERGRHSISGQHLEDNSVYTWDFPSWGTSNGRIGYQMRAYADDNHEVRPHTTRYWDGGGSNQNCFGGFVIEEYVLGV